MALFKACDNGDLAAVQEELSKAPKLRASGPNGRTPLWIASMRGHTGVVRCLIASGKANTMVCKADALLGPPLLVAVANGHDDIGAMLVEAGADASGTEATGVFLVGMAVKKRLAKTTAAMIRAGCPLVSIGLGPTEQYALRPADDGDGIRALAHHIIAWGSMEAYEDLPILAGLGGRYDGVVLNRDAGAAGNRTGLELGPLCDDDAIVDALKSLFGGLDGYALGQPARTDLAVSSMLLATHYSSTTVVAWLLQNAPQAASLSGDDHMIAMRLCVCAALERDDAAVLNTVVRAAPVPAITGTRPGSVYREWSVARLKYDAEIREEHGGAPMVSRWSLFHNDDVAMAAYLWTGHSFPVMVAARHGNVEALGMLQSLGANVDAEGALEPDDMWRNNYMQAHMVMHTGLTPLSLAVIHNHAGAVRWLVREGRAAINGRVPSLWLAAVFGHLNIAEVLVGLGADVESSCGTIQYLRGLGATSKFCRHLHGSDHTSCPPRPALWVAAGLGDIAMMNLLLRYKANPEGHSEKDESLSALWIASLVGNVDAMQVLLEAGASVNPRAPDGSTPLWAAARCNRADAARLLLSKGAPVDDRTDDGQSPLWIAATLGHMEVARVLASANARIDLADSTWGRTPLDQAKKMRQLRMTRALKTFYLSSDSVPHKARVSMWVLARRSQSLEASHSEAHIISQLGAVRDLPTDILLHIASLIPLPRGTQRVTDNEDLADQDATSNIHQPWWRPPMNPAGTHIYASPW